MFGRLGLILGFALLQYGLGEHFQLGNEPVTFGRLLYQSGQTFFTLGYGDILPTSEASRALAVLEAGMGFAFLGVVIGYIPVVYSSFSRREIQISMLDARAGSPPSATELLVRLAGRSDGPSLEQSVLDQVLRDWERWTAELLESHISYPGTRSTPRACSITSYQPSPRTQTSSRRMPRKLCLARAIVMSQAVPANEPPWMQTGWPSASGRYTTYPSIAANCARNLHGCLQHPPPLELGIPN